MTLESERSRFALPAGLVARLFEAVILAVEAGLVLASGAAIAGGLDAGQFTAALPGPIAVAAAYVLLVVAGGAAARPPRRARRGAAVRTLLTVFVVALLLDDNPLRTLPGLTTWLALATSGIVCWRWLAMRLAQAMPGFTPPLRPMAFIGNSEAAARPLLQIEADPYARLRPVGFFDDRSARTGPLHDKLPYLGTIDELVSCIHDHELQDVFLAMPWSAGKRISELIERLRFLPMTVRLIPGALCRDLAYPSEIGE
jgi:CoA-binding domain